MFPCPPKQQNCPLAAGASAWKWNPKGNAAGSLSPPPTRKEAEYLAAQYAYTQKERNKPQDMTIGGAMDAFIDARSAVLSPSTIRSYRQINRCYFQDLHALRLRDLTNTIVQRQVNAISLRCSPKTVRNALALLTSVLKVYHPDFPCAWISRARSSTRLPFPVNRTCIGF